VSILAEVTYDILEAEFGLKIPVYVEENNTDENPLTYIVFKNTLNLPFGYSDGGAKMEKRFFRINAYSADRLDVFAVLKRANSTLVGNGYFIQERNMPIPRDNKAPMWGAYSEVMRVASYEL
jgi:hypothetical protein